MTHRRFMVAFALILTGITATAGDFHIATFSADVTIPLGHRCMGILPVKAERIDDRLEANGFVLLGGERPVVVVALDWCELRNGAYERWREVLAEAAGTTRERVLVCCLHQHDAPVVDTDAQKLLDEVGLAKELCDPEFQEGCLQCVAGELRRSLKNPRRVTHLGMGEAKVEGVASNRRVVSENGRVSFDRGSSSGGEPRHSEAPDGTIDPFLKTLSFWNGDTPVLALHSYAVHPMSYYGKGGVSADFVGLARRKRQADDPQVAQIYVSGCSGDVTAGKYNDGAAAMRGVLAARLHAAMKQAWTEVKRIPLTDVSFRTVPIELPYREGKPYERETLTATLHNSDAAMSERILAAMAIASRNRVDAGHAIDLLCVDFGPAKLILFPAESFVGYQLLAQELQPDAFVFSVGYGECWPGYIPTQSAFDDGFADKWLWCGEESAAVMETALRELLVP